MADSIEGSWCDEGRKKELRKALDAVLEKWDGNDI